MSGAIGHVTFKNGLVYYYQYNGTADFCYPNLYKTEEECRKNWDTHPQLPILSSDALEEPVIIYSDYGNGFSWHGMASIAHMRITKGLNGEDYFPPNQMTAQLATVTDFCEM